MTTTTYLTIGSENALLVRPKNGYPGDGRRGCLVFHGHGGSSLQFAPGAFNGATFAHIEGLANLGKGRTVLAIDAAGSIAWGGPAAMTAADAAYTLLTTTLGAVGPVDLVGYSMGGLTALRYLIIVPARVHAAYLYSPVTDLAWAHGVAGWTSEIDTVYPGGTAGVDPATHASGYTNLAPMKIIHGDADTVIPYSKSQDFAAAAGQRAPVIVPGADHLTIFDKWPIDDAAKFLASVP